MSLLFFSLAFIKNIFHLCLDLGQQRVWPTHYNSVVALHTIYVCLVSIFFDAYTTCKFNELHVSRYLPEAEKAETALPILIQHDPNIHYGMCKSDAQSCCTVSCLFLCSPIPECVVLFVMPQKCSSNPADLKMIHVFIWWALSLLQCVLQTFIAQSVIWKGLYVSMMDWTVWLLTLFSSNETWVHFFVKHEKDEQSGQFFVLFQVFGT